MCDLSGLLIYLLLILLLSFSIIVKNHIYILILTMFISVIIASLRGDSGVDSFLYILRFEHLELSGPLPLIEPIIPSIMWIAKSLGGSFELFSFFYGIILAVLYYYIFRRFPNAIYFGLAIFPVIFIDSLFNGIRVGLAYPLVILSIAYSSGLILFIALSTHVSSLMAAPFKIIPIKYLLILFVLFVIAVKLNNTAIFDFMPERYVSKFNAYQNLATPNPYGGIADTSALFVSIFIYLRILGYRGYNLAIRIFPIFLLLVVYQIFFVVKFTFLLRVTRVLVVIVFGLIAKSRIGIDKVALYASFTFGVLYSANFIRQIISTCSYAEGGFLPLNLGG